MAELKRVAAAMAGDREALRALWQAERRWLAAVLLAYKPAEADLDDLLQDVAMTLVRTISTLREPDRLRPWLRSLAMNTARAAGRHESVRRRAIAEIASQRQRLSSEIADDGCEDARRVLRLAGQLPESYREPLLLRAVQGLSVEEIAQTLDLPVTTLQTRIARARVMLRGLAATDESGTNQLGPVPCRVTNEEG